MTEGRSQARHPTQPPWPVSLTDSGASFGEAVNLSEHGMMLLCPEPLERRSVWRIAMDCSEAAPERSPIHLSCEVRWCTRRESAHGYGCGLQFLAIDRRDAELIHYLVSLLSAHAA